MSRFKIICVLLPLVVAVMGQLDNKQVGYNGKTNTSEQKVYRSPSVGLQPRLSPSSIVNTITSPKPSTTNAHAGSKLSRTSNVPDISGKGAQNRIRSQPNNIVPTITRASLPLSGQIPTQRRSIKRLLPINKLQPSPTQSFADSIAYQPQPSLGGSVYPGLVPALAPVKKIVPEVVPKSIYEPLFETRSLSEAIPEPILKTNYESDVSEPTQEDVPEPAPGDVSEPALGDILESTPVDISVPAPGDVSEPAPGVISEPTLEVISEPDSQDILESAPVDILEPATGDVSEPAPGGISEPAPGDILEPNLVDISETAPGDVSEGAPGVVSEPAPGDILEPSPVDILEPALVDTPEPPPGNVAEPALGDNLEPTSVDMPEPAPGDVSLLPLQTTESWINNCTNGDGYYAVADTCDAYILCKAGETIKHTCPDGLNFNPVARLYEYPCSYPSEVKCDGGVIEHTSTLENRCPRRHGYFAIEGGDCSKYITCQEGMPITMNCPVGLVFNTDKNICDWPVNVPQCNLNVFRGFPCPLDYDSDIIIKYRYRDHCRYYIACHKGYPRLLKCNTGLAFKEEYQMCVSQTNVTDCDEFTLK